MQALADGYENKFLFMDKESPSKDLSSQVKHTLEGKIIPHEGQSLAQKDLMSKSMYTLGGYKEFQLSGDIRTVSQLKD